MRQRASTGRGDAPAVRLEIENEWAWCGERRLELTPREFAVLRHLVERPGRLVTKDELLAAVWGDTVVSEAALTSCIRDLRRGLGDSSRAPRYIETVHRRGFRFIGRVGGRASPATGERRPPPPADRVLVGRDAELARLRAHFATATTGRRQLVFLTGEAGIGKTALVERFLAELAAEHPVRVGRGQCVEQYGAGEPYLPVLEALGRLGREPGGADVVSVLRRYAPTWLVELPALLADADVEAVQRRAQGATRERMLREATEALDALARDAPFVLVLEDLHWSDSATVDLLAMLARRRDPARALIVATYRPADVAAAAHPVVSLTRELRVHELCDEVALEYLSEAAVRDYLERRFPDASFPPDLAPVLQRDTSGTPLFLVAIVDDLVAQGRVRDAGGRWELAAPADEITRGVPSTLRQMIERQVERLTADEQAILAIGAVAGAEFSAALASCDGMPVHDAERWCADLARRRHFLRNDGLAAWPDGTVAGRYAFVHALHREVLYARVPAGHRVGLHLRIGARLEAAHGAGAGEVAGELAVHFEHGRDFERGLRYRLHAADAALRHHGYREAADHAARALALLGELPDSPARIAQELLAHEQLGAAFTALKGSAAPEVEPTYARIRELCGRLGATPQTFPALFALSRYHITRGDLARTADAAADLAALAETTGDPAVRVAACNTAGIAAFYRGDFAPAVDELERSMDSYDSRRHSPARLPAFRVAHDPAVSAAVHSAWALWLLGHPDRAAARMRQALEWARAADHALTLVFACHFAAAFHACLGERDAVAALDEEAVRLSAEHGFLLFGEMEMIHRGWLAAGDGRREEAVALMLPALARYRARGAELVRPMLLGVLGEVYHRAGRAEEGLAILTEELATPQTRQVRYWDAELVRWKGELARSCGAHGDAEAAFAEALATARRQGARSFELRAAMSLARLWRAGGRRRQALELLSDVHGRFTEGFHTGDLRAARTLRDELAGPRRG